jgi:uncharacterized membrane protein
VSAIPETTCGDAVRGGASRQHSRRAADVLAERYARGEIDTDEFQAR